MIKNIFHLKFLFKTENANFLFYFLIFHKTGLLSKPKEKYFPYILRLTLSNNRSFSRYTYAICNTPPF